MTKCIDCLFSETDDTATYFCKLVKKNIYMDPVEQECSLGIDTAEIIKCLKKIKILISQQNEKESK